MTCLDVCRLQRELQAKRQELQQKLVEDASKLATIIAETKELKSFVEEHISGLVKGYRSTCHRRYEQHSFEVIFITCFNLTSLHIAHEGENLRA